MMNRKQLFQASTAHVLVVSFLLAGMGIILIGLQDSLKKAESSLRQSLKVVVFIQSNISDDLAKVWAETLPSQDPAIESAVFISRQEALAKAQGNPALVKSLILLRDNPLPATVLLRYRDSAWLERSEPATALRASPEVQELRWDPEARSLFRSLSQWRFWLVRISIFAAVLMLMWCSFGLYRFKVMRAPARALLLQLGLGLLGGGLALLIFGLALQRLGSDAAVYSPLLISPWPIAAAIMAAIATFGWKVADEA